MRDPLGTIWSLLWGRLSPIVVVLYGEHQEREALAQEVENTADPSWPVRTFAKASDAMDALPSDLVLLLPDDEQKAVDDLDCSRERNLERKAPIVLFLQRGGEALSSLRAYPNL